jgi:hypothetical protein
MLLKTSWERKPCFQGFLTIFLTLTLISRREEVKVSGRDPGGRGGKGGLLPHHLLDLGINI